LISLWVQAKDGHGRSKTGPRKPGTAMGSYAGNRGVANQRKDCFILLRAAAISESFFFISSILRTECRTVV